MIEVVLEVKDPNIVEVGNLIEREIRGKKIVVAVSNKDHEIYILHSNPKIDRDRDRKENHYYFFEIHGKMYYGEPKPFKDIIDYVLGDGYKVYIFEDYKDFARWILF